MRSPPRVVRLVGVYDADGTITGELRYVIGHLLGRLECALCDITHGAVRRKPAIDELRRRLGIPFELVHRDERDAAVTAATGDRLPVVVAEVEVEPPEGSGAATRTITTLLDRDQLQACGGHVDAFESALRSALARVGSDPD